MFELYVRLEQVRVADAETALKKIQTRLKEEETRTLMKDDFLDNDNLGKLFQLVYFDCLQPDVK